MLDAVVVLIVVLLVASGVLVMLGPSTVVRGLRSVRRPRGIKALFEPHRPREVAAPALNPKTQRVLVAASRLANWLRAHGHVDPDPYVQARRCFEIIATALGEAGTSVDQVVRTRMFVTDAAYAEAVGRAHGEVMRQARPTATMVVVKALLDDRWKVEIEAEAVIS